MRTLFDDRPGAACPTGVGRYTRSVAALLPGVPGHECVALSQLAFEAGSPSENELGLPALLQREGIDVFHSPLWHLPAALPCLAICTVHDAIPVTHPDLASDAFRPLWRHAVTEVRRADAIVCPSAHARERVIDALGLDPDVVHVVPEAPDAVFAPRPAADVAAALDRSGVEPQAYLLSVGSIERRKNPDGLLEALAALPAASRPLLLFAGPAAGFDLTAEAERRGLGDCVRHLGFVDDDTLAALYSGALAVLCCSRAEGFGLPVVEAWACDAPVIASNTTSVVEVAGDATLLVDPEDPQAIAGAITRCLDSEDLREDLRRRGRARLASCYSPEAARTALARLYDSLAVEVTS